MKSLDNIFKSNEEWSEKIIKERPGFFDNLREQQNPKYLWIGCSDSRVPANQICGMEPGEVFVHRNVGNIVNHSDFNCLSVVQYAVDILKVKDIIICGHYGCGGVNAALEKETHGLIDNWLWDIKHTAHHNKIELDKITNITEKQNLLSELNVKSQVFNLAHTTIIQEAWKRDQDLTIHGLIYGIYNGKLIDLNLSINSIDDLTKISK